MAMDLFQLIMYTYIELFEVYKQFDSFVPVDNVATDDERLYVNDVNVSSTRSYVEPARLER